MILELQKNDKASTVEKEDKIFEDLVLKQLHEHYYSFENNERKNHHSLPGLMSQAGL